MRGRLRFSVVVVAVAAGAVAAGWWAARTAMEPPALPEDEVAAVWYTVTDDVVGHTVEAQVTGSWRTEGELLSPSSGVLTQWLVDSGTEVEAGQVVATVDLRPVVVAPGDVPAFRDLRGGASGLDVEQLQAFLADQGLLDPAVVDGRFGPVTREAVLAWQERLGIDRSGVVRLGDLIFVPNIPVRLRLTVGPGERVQAGQPIGDILAPVPDFRAEIRRLVFDDVPAGAAISFGTDEARWEGQLGAVLESGAEFAVVDVDPGQELCDARCEHIAIDGATRMGGRVVVQPERRGPTVPSSAVVLTPGGRHAVRVDGRGLVEVEVLAEASGRAVLAGVSAGERVEVPGEAEP